MKKKGFTLIELLAVIVILAIITVIAVPKIIDVIEKSEKQSFLDSAKLIESGIKTQLGSSDILNQDSFTKDENNCYLFDFTNKNDNYNKLNVKNKENYTGKIKYCNNKFIYTEFSNGKYTLNTNEEGNNTIDKVGKIKTYIVTFDTDGGTSIEKQTIEKGKTVIKPSNPSKKGYDFIKWTLNENEYTFTEKVTKNITLKAVWKKSKICKRATKLHTEECTQTGSNDCSGAGYTTSGSKGTSTITYGNLGTSGTLTSGDAFDCDVNGDGIYDSTKERFYYVSDYYNTTTKAFESDTAVLIYYSDVIGGNPSNNSKQFYYSSNENWHGPVTAKKQLPTTSQWSNVSLKNTARAILNENGGNTTKGGTLPNNFSYSGYSARLLTTQEISKACNITTFGIYKELDSCNYLMENTQYSSLYGSSVSGYWLETAEMSNSIEHPETYCAWRVASYYRRVDSNYVYDRGFYNGVRPTIEVSKVNISY